MFLSREEQLLQCPDEPAYYETDQAGHAFDHAVMDTYLTPGPRR